MRKKSIAIISIIAVLVILSITGIFVSRPKQDQTVLMIDGTPYPRDAVTLDLSGTPLAEAEKLAELTQLQQLDLRDTGITAAQYESLRTALPGCEIFWSVPLQGGFCDNTAAQLELTALSGADLDAFRYLPNLTQVRVSESPEPEVLSSLGAQYPHISLSYPVTLGGTEYDCTVQELTLTAPDAQELLTKLRFLPGVKTVRLEGPLPEMDQLLNLKDTYPDITFSWDFELYGIPTCSTAEFLDLSGLPVTVQEVESWLPCFYDLAQVDMCGCGISNEEMDALNQKYPDTKFVWSITISGIEIRTDTTFFAPGKYGVGLGNRSELNALKYCTDMVMMDLGHYRLTNVDFIQYMPELKYLLLCEVQITDLTPIGNCVSLEYLELFMSAATDFWPLTNLTNLRDLNISGTPYRGLEDGYHVFGPFGDATALAQMTWLDRLWITLATIPSEQKAALEAALPNTMINFKSAACTTGGFRYTPRYYLQRDMLEMPYAHN